MKVPDSAITRNRAAFINPSKSEEPMKDSTETKPVPSHTPGPWKVRPSHDATGYPCYFIHGISGEQKHHEPTLVANARLIAAAPDLLEACEDALYTLSFANGDCPVCKRLKAAIAKARGE
jgi:hypothetical protein